jgi:hypothetical protein
MNKLRVFNAQHEFDSRHSQVLPGDEYHAAAEGKDPDLG